MEQDRDKPWNFHNCGLCPYASKSIFLMSKHLSRHERLESNPFNCNLLNRLELYDYECELCQIATGLKVNLIEHILVFHKGQEVNDVLPGILDSYKCKHCCFNTYSLLVLLKHVSSCHQMSQNIKVKLPTVIKHRKERDTMYKPQDLNQHPPNVNASKVKRFKCDECIFKCNHKRDLNRHILQKHTSPEEINWYRCHTCSYKARQKKYLKDHMLIHTPLEEINWFQCDNCIFKTKRKSDLNKHILNKHTPAKESKEINWYRCDKCSHKCKRKYNLKSHVSLVHQETISKWYICDKCPYKAKQKFYLKDHMLIHTPLKDVTWYECAQCVFKTKRKRDLKKHILYKHTPAEAIKWHQCDECSYKTKRRSHLKNHTLRVHKYLNNELVSMLASVR